jgi:hypothetical protein
MDCRVFSAKTRGRSLEREDVGESVIGPALRARTR